MENKEKEIGASATTENTGTIRVTEKKKSFEELLKDKEYQSAFDKKVTKSLQTARIKWEEKNNKKKLKKNYGVEFEIFENDLGMKIYLQKKQGGSKW